MSEMETEPPDNSNDLYARVFPEINDESMAEYERLNSMKRESMTMDERSLHLKDSIENYKIRQIASNYKAQNDRQTPKKPKKKAIDPPPKIPDHDRCRHHKEIQKDVKLMTGRLTFLETLH
ncbi:hypothetical protein TNCV_3918311 [Trichonephila clavipes]|nr:hypothetical protein TNCV_3918311 [Trichonephila clavipes]